MCPIVRLSSPTSSGSSRDRRPSRALSTCCLMCCTACWGASACPSYVYLDVLCWLHDVRTMPESSHAAAHVRQWKRTVCMPLTPSAWPGPTSWTVTVFLQLRKRAATTHCLISEVIAMHKYGNMIRCTVYVGNRIHSYVLLYADFSTLKWILFH